MSASSAATARSTSASVNPNERPSPSDKAVSTDDANEDQFLWRHLGPRPGQLAEMLERCGEASLDALMSRAVPGDIRLKERLNLPEALSEKAALERLAAMAGRNRVHRSFLGLGYHNTITPPVIQRNLLENPGWYTQYTPYQAEIAQGRLEGLLNFQTMVCDLTGLDFANASLLDEATAAAEAMTFCHALKGRNERRRFLVSDACHPQTIEVLQTRAEALGLRIEVVHFQSFRFDESVFGILLQYPDTHGAAEEYGTCIEAAHACGALAVVATDLLSLTMLKPPGEFGADVAVGSAQRFGVPLGFGGPHAAFFTTRAAFKRNIPGRIVGVSKDTDGNPALRLTLQTREQHIRREKATSNICTAQALLANIASMFAVYHGPNGLLRIARRVHRLACRLADELRSSGCTVQPEVFFDTVTVAPAPDGPTCEQIVKAARARGIDLRAADDRSILVALDETATDTDVDDLLAVFGGGQKTTSRTASTEGSATAPSPISGSLERTTPFLTHPVFNRYHSETEMMRYMKRLENRDLSLTAAMIPLGSCTMKLNSAAEMLSITLPGFSQLHPFIPADHAPGYAELVDDLERWLAEITGLDGVSLQPNAGSQGEYAGLLVIRRFHQSRGETNRDVCLIPTSAHGTNPASATMAGLRVVPVPCDADGNIDIAGLRSKATEYRDRLAALMVTYPSTHGVFEAGIRNICEIVHEHGGQVYLDGANMNAQVGLCSPATIGADVCHLNLHKTFCIPHGGGGPGVGPIAVAKHLTPFLPGHRLAGMGSSDSVGAIAAAPHGSASILPISWAYIAMMGAEGLTQATRVAILAANYVAKRLEDSFPILYRGNAGLVAHECILDLRQFKRVTVEDVAKRLMDYGFHAPTISWPVAGTMMVEPTESESKEELDRFCDAMIAIHAEIMAVESGAVDPKNNLLKNAPHTAVTLAADSWNRPYTRREAVFPTPHSSSNKFWPAVSRIDNVYGDRNPICTCAGMEAFDDD